MPVLSNTFKKWALGALALVLVGTITAIGTQQGSFLKGFFGVYYIEIQVNTEYGSPITGLDATSFSAGSTTISSVTESGTTDGLYIIPFSTSSSVTVTVEPSGYVSQTVSAIPSAGITLNATLSLHYGHHIIVVDSAGAAITGATVTMGTGIPTTCIESGSSAGIYGCPYYPSGTAGDYNVSKTAYLSASGTFTAGRSSNSSAELNTTVVLTSGTDSSYSSSSNILVRNASGTYMTGLTTPNFSNSCGIAITGVSESSTRTGSYTLSFDQDKASCTVSAAVSGYVTASTGTFSVDGPSTVKDGTVVLPYGHTITIKDSSTSAAVTGATITTTPSYTCAETTTAGTYGCVVPLSTTISYSISKSGYGTATGSFTGTRSSDSSAALTSSVNLTATNYGVTLTQSSDSTTVTEAGSTDNYTIALNAAPTSDVTITVTPDTQVTVSPGSLTFTSSNWNTAQTVTVGAVNDSTVEGTHSGVVTHTATSSDSHYNGISISSVSASITDNDSNGVTISESSGSTSVTEGSTTDTYTVVLNTAPTSNVTITLTPDSQVTVSASILTFTTSNWSTAQTITVTAVSDSTTETTQSGTIKHSSSSSDTNYNAITIASVVATVSDAGTTSSSCSGMPFTDVKSTDWFCEYIYQLYHKSVVKGTDSSHFSPNNQVTRAEAIKMIDVLLLGNPAPSGSSVFLDVSSANWYYDYAISAANNDVARKTDNGGYFYGDIPCTRGWLAVYVARALDLTSYSYSVDYSDVNHSDFDAYAIAILSDKTFDDPYDDSTSEVSVIEGYSDGTFGPNNNIARSEAAAMIYRAYEAYMSN
jgi:hypothetical protein